MENLKHEVMTKHLLRTQPRLSGCVEWLGARKPNGYGSAMIRGVSWNVHRLFYTAFVAPIPAGMQVLHKCDNRACVSPNHLWLGTQLDNMRDMEAKGRSNRTGGPSGNKVVAANRRAKTHCIAGHPLSGANLYIAPGKSSRCCKTCKRHRKINARLKRLDSLL